jgi:hypothetical protein
MLFKRSADNWAVFLDYLTSLFHLEGNPPIDDARSFLKEMQNESKLNRGPFLAEVRPQGSHDPFKKLPHMNRVDLSTD